LRAAPEQGLRELAVGLRHRGHARSHGGGCLLSLGGHQVEELAHILDPAINHVEVAGDVPGVMALHGQGQPLLHRGPCGPLVQPGGLGSIEGREGCPIQLGPFGEPVALRSGSSWSCPAIPAKVAMAGSKAAARST
jgi:hypothetical protein